MKDGENGTVSCAEGDTGYVYAELLEFSVKSSSVETMPDLPLKVMMNVGNPNRAFDFACLPNEGVGLARLEFIINRMIGVHPRALLEFDDQEPQLQNEIREMMKGFDSPREFYVGRLTEGIATLGAAFYPKRVIVRLSDFKSNEYANLVGGERYEPDEENPMLGFRGAGRYVSDSFRDCFALECEAVKRVRNDMGLTNVEIMIPFVRTVDQAKAVVEELARQGLKRGENGLKIIMMCEIQFSLTQFINHRHQLPFHNAYFYLRMLLMKTRYDSWHQTAGNTGPHADINLPCQLPLSLANILLGCAQLFKN